MFRFFYVGFAIFLFICEALIGVNFRAGIVSAVWMALVFSLDQF